MDRRAFIAGSVGLGLAPGMAWAQQRRIPTIGVLRPGTPPDPLIEALLQGLRDHGHVEGRNIRLEYRWAEGMQERLGALAADLVRLPVDIITTWSTPAALAAKSLTTAIPIVFAGVGDPVRTGLVASLARPGANVTGVSTLAEELSGKRLELLRETVPKVGRVAMVWNSTNPSMVFRARETQMAADKLGVVIQSFGVHELNDFDQVFAAMTRQHPDAVLTLVDPFTTAHRQRIVDFAAAQRMVAVYEVRQFVEAGGLMSYGPSLSALQQRVALFIDKILRGAKPADLPVEQPTKFELVINLKTAKTLGLTIPQSVLQRADQVIE